MSKEKEQSTATLHEPPAGDRAGAPAAAPASADEAEGVSELSLRPAAEPTVQQSSPSKLTKKERKRQKKERLKEKREKREGFRHGFEPDDRTAPADRAHETHPRLTSAISPARETPVPAIMSGARNGDEGGNASLIANEAPQESVAELGVGDTESARDTLPTAEPEPSVSEQENGAAADELSPDAAGALDASPSDAIEAPAVETPTVVAAPVEPAQPEPQVAEYPGDGLKDESAPASISMQQAAVAEPPRARPGEILVPCGIVRRLAATCFDLLFLVTVDIVATAIYVGSLVHIFLKPLVPTEPDPLLAPERTEEMLLFIAGLALFNYLYYAFCECWPISGTLGKHVFNLRVAGTEKKRVSIFRSNYRLLCRIVTAGTLGIGYLMAFVRPRHTLHDRLSRTMVVHVSELKKLKP